MAEEKKGKPQESSSIPVVQNRATTETQNSTSETKTGGFFSMEGVTIPVEKPALLLHSCCGPCSTVAVERLAAGYQITIFFYNPCITDEEEYKRRRESQLDFVKKYNTAYPPKEHIHFSEGSYDTKSFFQVAHGLEQEPEGGKRCRECFLLRLEKTAETARLSGRDYFATTLTTSPHKEWETLSKIGRILAAKYNLSFVDMDFKKQNGYQRSVELSKKYQLYRQNYCGCEYSKDKTDKRPEQE